MADLSPRPGTVRIEIAEVVVCDRCDEDGLVEDENWWPDFPGQRRTWGPPNYGIVKCGCCDGDKWWWSEVFSQDYPPGGNGG